MKVLARTRFWVLPAFALLLTAAPAGAQGRKLTVSDLTAEPPVGGHPAAGLVWRPRSSEFSYLVQKGGEDGPTELWLEPAARSAKTKDGGKRLLVSTTTLLVPEEPGKDDLAPGSGRPPSRPPRHLPLEGYQWSPDGQALLLSGEHDVWLYRLPSGPLDRLTKSAETEEVPTFSPDGTRVAFVRLNDLYALELATRKETRLTSDGSEAVSNGRLDWVYEEELASRTHRSYEWSPDGRSLAYLRLDDGPVPKAPIVDYVSLPAAVAWQRYPLPGTANPMASLRIVSTDGQETSRYDAENDSYIVPGFAWTADSRAVGFRSLTRAQNHVDLRLLEPSGSTRVLLYEDDPAWINVLDPPRFLADGRFIWKSERSGFAHLYVGSIAGGDLKPITHGDWMVDHFGGVDSKGLVYFSSTEDGPRSRGIHRVRLDGKGLARLTTGGGTHVPEVSADGRFVLDTSSTFSSPASISVLDAGRVDPQKGAKLLHVAFTPENRLDEFAMGVSEDVEVTADDGVKLVARLLKPRGFDPAKKYPVVVYVYGGPHGQIVRDQWSANGLFDHLLAGRGFLVWALDNRGSWGRGHAWEAALNREMGKRELADQLAGVRYLKSLPYVDGARLGIWGGSYGGYLTLYALVNSPETWKAGVAAAPVTDWKFYDSVYTERYMKTPAENPKGYESSAPLSKAARLRAKLLLIHGTVDDNVHLQNTVAFVDALVKAGRPYELQLTPGQKHAYKGKTALASRYEAIVGFFERNL